ncbi:hypothetical protein BDM02DRAFT_3066898, partial [Thelephora ganbajun]
FKYGGASRFIQEAKEEYGSDLYIISASSGNPTLAVACAPKVLFCKCAVFITRDASQEATESLKPEDVGVVAGGNLYSETLEKTKAAVAANPNAYVL